MFGGAGLFLDGGMFGLIDEGRIYLKTDAELDADLRAAGAGPWIYVETRSPKAGVREKTSYLTLPDDAVDDSEAACAWGARALEVAARRRAPRGVRGESKPQASSTRARRRSIA